jgi:hypothetical protein
VEHWVCAACKSFNVQRAQRCYSCNMPRAQSEAGGAAVKAGAAWAPESVTGEARAAAEAAGMAVKSTDTRAKLTLAIIPAVMAASVVRYIAGVVTGSEAILTNFSGWEDPEIPLGLLLLVRGAESTLFAIGVAAFLWWLSAVVDNIPALGGGWPPVSGRGAIGWWFVPGANVFQGPRIIADAHERLAVSGRTGAWLVGAWWASFLVSAIFERVLRYGIEFFVFVEDPAMIARLALISGTVRLVLFLAAGFLAMKIVMEIEASQEVRIDALNGNAPVATSLPATA